MVINRDQPCADENAPEGGGSLTPACLDPFTPTFDGESGCPYWRQEQQLGSLPCWLPLFQFFSLQGFSSSLCHT
jgi:hypothetical protein